jgi:hypothetical protein
MIWHHRTDDRSKPVPDRRRNRSRIVSHDQPREKKTRPLSATRSRRRRSELRSAALHQAGPEALEARALLTFIPLPAAQLSVAESAFSITPFSTVVAKFQGNPGDFYLGSIDWGDGTVDPNAFAFPEAGSPSTFDVFSSSGHTYFEEGLYSIKAGVADLSSGNPADGGVTTNTALVSDAPLALTSVNPIVGTEGLLQTFTLATFNDPDTGPPTGPNPNSPTDYSATVNWGDGTPITQATIVSLGGGNYAVQAPHTYADEIALAAGKKATVVITDTEGENPPQGTRASVTATPTVQVNDAPISVAAPSPPPATFVEGSTSAGIVGILTDSNPNAPASDFAAPGGSVSINWGDSTPTTPGFLQPLGGGKFNIFGFHAYAEEGNKIVTVTAVDTGGAPQASVSYTLNVKDAAFSAIGQSLSSTEGLTSTPLVAVITDNNPNGTASDFSGTINFGDGTGVLPFGPGSVTVVGHTTTSTTLNVLIAHTFAEEGLLTGTIVINDVGGAPTQTVNFLSNVADAALSATASQPVITATEGQVKTSELATFTDADPAGNPAVDYKASIDWGDGTAIDTTTATFTKDGGGVIHVSGTHSYLEEGKYRAVITITDTDGPTGSTTVPRSSVAVANTVTVADAPLAVAPGSPTAIAATEGQPLSQIIIAKFSDTDPNELEPGDLANLEYTVSVNWGDGTAIDNSAVIVQTGLPGSPYNILGSNHIYPNEGTFQVTITVQDVGGAPPLVINTTANVGEAPLVPTTPPAPTITVPEGQNFSGVVASFINADPFEPPAEQVYTLLSIDWGDGNVTGGSIVPNGTGGFNVLGSHTYAEENAAGYTISVKVKESVEADSTASTLTNKAIVPDAPITVNPLTISATEGLVLTNATVATFTDGDLLNINPGDYSISINWGDGSPTTAGTAVFDGAGLWHVVGTHTYAEEGVYAPNPFTGTGGILVSVIDTDGGPTNAPGRASGSTASTALVGDAPLTPQPVRFTNDSVTGAVITEGKPFVAVVGQFSDANPGGDLGDFFATINWGDGTGTSQGIVSQPGGPGTSFIVSSNHSYTEDGVFAVQIFVGDIGGSTTIVNSTAVVADAALSNTPAGTTANPLTGAEGATFSGPIATLTDGDPNAVSGDFSVTINWGDGTPASSGSFTQIGVGKFIVSGNHLYAEDGLFTIAYTITDTDGHLSAPPAVPRSTTSGSSAIQVLDAPLFNIGVATPPAANEGASTGLLTLAKFGDTDPGAQTGDYSAVINWGDGSPTTTGTIGGTALSGFTVSGSHTYAEEKASGYTVTVSITDDDHHLGGAPAVPRATLTATTTVVVNDAPLTATPVAPIAFTEGLALTNVTVANFSDADLLNTNAGDYVASINWGDGTAGNGIVTQTGTGTWTVMGSHTYKEEGSFPIVVTITDTDGLNVPVGPRATTVASEMANVADAALVDKTPIQTLAATEGGLFSGTVAQFTDNDPGGNTFDYIATINWGDGTPTVTGVPAVLLTNGNFGINGSHSYAEEGLRTVTVQIFDTDGGSTTGRVSVTTTNTKINVADAAISIVSTPFSLPGAPEGFATSNVPLAVFKDANAAAPVTDFLPVSAGGEGGSVVVNWGDGTALQTLPASSIQSAGGGFFIVRGTHTYAEDGVFKVDVTVTDGGGAPPVSLSTSTGRDTITVPDAPLSPLPPSGSQPAGNPQHITTSQNIVTGPVLIGTFVDADPGAQVGDYSGVINWGDGSSPDTTATFGPGLAPGSFNVFGTHTFTTFGVFSVSVVITDTDGHLGSTPAVPRAMTTLSGTVVTVNAAQQAAQQQSAQGFVAPTPTASMSAASSPMAQSSSQGSVFDQALSSLVNQSAPMGSSETVSIVSLKKKLSQS